MTVRGRTGRCYSSSWIRYDCQGEDGTALQQLADDGVADEEAGGGNGQAAVAEDEGAGGQKAVADPERLPGTADDDGRLMATRTSKGRPSTVRRPSITVSVRTSSSVRVSSDTTDDTAQSR